MPGDSMELSVDFRTQRATQNAQALNAEIDKMAKSTAEATRVIYTLDTAADKLAEDEQKAAKAAANMAQEMGRAGDAATKAGQNVQQAGGQIDDATNKIAKGAENLAQQVKNWVGAYAGLNGALRLLHDFNAMQEKIVENQKEFVQSRLGRDQVLEGVQRNLQLPFTSQGQDTARALVEGMADKTKLSFENAAALVSSVNAAGFRPLTKVGAQSSEMIGRFAAMGGLDTKQIEGLARLVSNQGLQADPAGIQSFLGRIYQTFTKTDTTSFGAFIDQAIPALNLAREKGMPQTQALGMLSAYLSTSASPDQGGDRMRMMLRMGESATPKLAAFMAQQARLTGLTHPGTVTMADIESMAAGGDQDKKGKLERIRDLESGMSPMDIAISEQTTRITELEGARVKTPKQEQARQDNLRVAQERLSEAKRRRAERVHDIEMARKTAVDEVQSERDIEAFNAVPVARRVQMLQQLFRSVKGNTAARSRLIQGMGGRGQLVDAVEAASGAVFGEKEADAAAAAGMPGAGDALARQMADRLGSSVAQSSAAGEQNERNLANAGGPGAQFATESMRTAEGFYRVGMNEHGWIDQMLGPTGTHGLGVGLTDDARKARYIRASAYDYINRLTATMSPAERTAYGPRLQNALKNVFESEAGTTGAGQLKILYDALNEAGTIRKEIADQRSRRGGPAAAQRITDLQIRAVDPFKVIPVDPGGAHDENVYREGPTTRPSGPTSINYNISVGNHFSGSGSDLPLPGRLEDLA